MILTDCLALLPCPASVRAPISPQKELAVAEAAVAEQHAVVAAEEARLQAAAEECVAAVSEALQLAVGALRPPQPLPQPGGGPRQKQQQQHVAAPPLDAAGVAARTRRAHVGLMAAGVVAEMAQALHPALQVSERTGFTGWRSTLVTIV